jgi:hypothetical protein
MITLLSGKSSRPSPSLFSGLDQHDTATGAQAALRADQFRSRNASRCDDLCDPAGKFRLVFLVGGVFGAGYWLRSLLFHQQTCASRLSCLRR